MQGGNYDSRPVAETFKIGAATINVVLTEFLARHEGAIPVCAECGKRCITVTTEVTIGNSTVRYCGFHIPLPYERAADLSIEYLLNWHRTHNR